MLPSLLKILVALMSTYMMCIHKYIHTYTRTYEQQLKKTEAVASLPAKNIL